MNPEEQQNNDNPNASTIEFDDEIVKNNLLDLFKILNNKKNFKDFIVE